MGNTQKLQSKHRPNNANIRIVSGSACPGCNGTGKEDVDYYEDDDIDHVITIKETCLLCDGSGVFE